MVICRFFKEGRCNFGEKCWNEHIGHVSDVTPRSATHWMSPSYAAKNQHTYQAPIQKNFNQNSFSFRNASQQDPLQKNFNQNSFSFRNASSQAPLQNNFNQTPFSFRNSSRDIYSQEANEKYEEYENGAFLGNDERVREQRTVKSNSAQFNSFSSDERRKRNDEEISAVKSDIVSWENGNMWPFSCYSHFKNKDACFPGFADISLEELRFKAYEAEQRNEFPSYVAAVNTAMCDIKEKWKVLRESGPSYIESIRPEYALDLTLCPDLVRDMISHSSKEFSDNSNTMQTEGNFFSKVQSGSSGGFKLDHLSSPSSSTSSFGFVMPSEEMKTDKTTFGPTLGFGNNEILKPLQSHSENTPSLSMSKIASKTSDKGDVDNSNYTPLGDLTEQEKDQFCSQTFTLGKIPTRPPPLEMCF